MGFLALAISLAAAPAGCRSHGGDNTDGGDGGDAHTDGGSDTSVVQACLAVDASVKKAKGESCGCDADCASNFCVDGVCCNEQCGGGCRTCAFKGSEGTCVARTVGTNPRNAGDCPIDGAPSCGHDGKCDGAGACRLYASGTVCKGGTCDGDSVTGAQVCDGAGHCRPGPTTICPPYACDPSKGACFETCSSSAQCVAGHACDAKGSCGMKMRGASCKTNDDCLSGFCANNICCNVACQGACVSCSLPSREGTCWPLPAGSPDPNGVCKDQGAASCGLNGTCDGVGGCARYAKDTPCAQPFCTANIQSTAATCDGLGTCGDPGLVDCAPFLCLYGGCTTSCRSDSDCSKGIACVNGTCGPKQNGQTCKAASECKSNFCVDGVCCENACSGACRTCALPSAPGKCSLVATGNADPRTMCKDNGSSSCTTNGKCDGKGGCQQYDNNTVCSYESCSNNQYTAPSKCDGSGHCVKPGARNCDPFTCNGSSCFTACTADKQCNAPNHCVNNSCGLQNNGASCSSGAECKTGFCAQGYCCDKACNGACQSCGLSGSQGRCSNVPDGSSDPVGMCKDQGSGSCGNTGKCQGGQCQKYANGTSCGSPSCATTTNVFTPGASCNGSGTCVKPASQQCSPYICGGSSCKNVCASNNDCIAPNQCVNGSCGLLGAGRTCQTDNQCQSGHCAQGVCCNTTCTGACKACNVKGLEGTCSNVPAGSNDPAGTCKDAGAASCGTNGVCDGSGACQKYPTGTVCMPANCMGAVTTNARTCTAAGVCAAATTTQCAPFQCNGTTGCLTTCQTDKDCTNGNSCVNGKCGKVPQGGMCDTTSDCASGLTCTDGVCCNSANCGACQACNINGKGTCSAVPDGMAPAGDCPPSTTMCGNTGQCVKGACEQVTGACGVAACTSKGFQAVGMCNAQGMCVQQTMSCGTFACTPTGCLGSCMTNADCADNTLMCSGGKCVTLGNAGSPCGGSNPACGNNLTCISNICCAQSCSDPNGTATCSANGKTCSIKCNMGYSQDSTGTCVPNNTTSCCGPSCQMCKDPPMNGKATCDGTSCGVMCDKGFHVSGSMCAANNTTSCCGDSCTTCPTVTGGTESCTGGMCVLTCNKGFHMSGTTCAKNDTTSCCGDSCASCTDPQNGKATCDGTSCGVTCDPGFDPMGGQCVAAGGDGG